MALSGQQFEIAAGDHSAVVVEVGAGLRSYTVGGVDVTIPYGEDVLAPEGDGAVLVPWPNRLRGGTYLFEGVVQQLALTEPEHRNAIHGLGRWLRWVPQLHEKSRVTLTLDLAPQPGYPFEVLVEVSYSVHPEFGLSVTTAARNHGTGRAPFGAGFHPYFSTHGTPLDKTTVQLPAGERLLLDEAAVPIGAQSVAGTPYDLRRGRRLKSLRLDDGFTALHVEQGRGEAEVRSGRTGTRVWFDETFRYLQVFTHENLGGAGPCVAVEPMTCAADAFNSTLGLIVLEPGGAWGGSWGIQPLA